MRQDIRTVERAPERRDPNGARRELRQWAAEVEREQLHEALGRLEAEGHVTGTQRRILEEMSEAIVEELLADPEAALMAEEEGNEGRTETVLDLFDCVEPTQS